MSLHNIFVDDVYVGCYSLETTKEYSSKDAFVRWVQ